MTFTDGQRYAAEVVAADLITSSRTGTEGIELRFDTEEGSTTHVLWLTERNRENVWRALAALGIQDASRFHPVRDMEQLIGARCTLTMGNEEYRGKTSVRVQWINPLRAAATADARQRAMAFFGHETAAAVALGTEDRVIAVDDDDDVPF
jgi:hypothetical protein